MGKNPIIKREKASSHYMFLTVQGVAFLKLHYFFFTEHRFNSASQYMYINCKPMDHRSKMSFTKATFCEMCYSTQVQEMYFSVVDGKTHVILYVLSESA